MNKASDPGATSQQWDEQSDVVVVGYGGAGATAAISAYDAGARVMVLEAMAEGGGNTRVSMGGFLCPSDRQEAFTYISSLYDACHSQKDETVIRAFIEEAVKNVRWIEGLKEGTRTHVYGYAGFPEVPGAGSMKKYLVKGKGMTTFARNLWRVLSYAVEEKRRHFCRRSRQKVAGKNKNTRHRERLHLSRWFKFRGNHTLFYFDPLGTIREVLSNCRGDSPFSRKNFWT